MSAAPVLSNFVSVEDYLRTEESAEEKHEYLAGTIYAMAGAGEAHNFLTVNLNARLRAELRGGPCRNFGSDMKIRLNSVGYAWFYYPDAMIVCDSSDAGRAWRERPCTLFEVLSPGTRSIDEREKRNMYLQLGSLEAYVRIEPDRPEVVVERRTAEGWKLDRICGLTSTVYLTVRGWEITLPLADLYDGVTFPE